MEGKKNLSMQEKVDDDDDDDTVTDITYFH